MIGYIYPPCAVDPLLCFILRWVILLNLCSDFYIDHRFGLISVSIWLILCVLGPDEELFPPGVLSLKHHVQSYSASFHSCISIMQRLHPHNTIIPFHNPALDVHQTVRIILISQAATQYNVLSIQNKRNTLHMWSILPFGVYVHVSL